MNGQHRFGCLTVRHPAIKRTKPTPRSCFKIRNQGASLASDLWNYLFKTKEHFMNATSDPQCACLECTCSVDPQNPIKRNGKLWCSDACADLHPNGAPCPHNDCHCEQSFHVKGRTISDSQLDEAVEETFPASDPISP